MLELLSLQENDRILEIGFGTGKLISEMVKLANRGFIEGIDFSDTMMNIAQKRLKQHIFEKKVNLRKGDFLECEYADSSFDKICSANTIYFWQQPDEYIRKMFKILKPGGKLVLGFTDKKHLESKSLSTDVFQLFSEDDVKNLLICNGFSDSVDVLSRRTKHEKYHCAVAVK